MTDIVFMDTETLGINPDAPVWEFAAIRRSAEGDTPEQFLIKHDASGWEDDLPEPFIGDYRARYRAVDALYPLDAARRIEGITRGCHIVGAVPSFDTERLAKLMRRKDIEPTWHYHLIDVENLIVGYLAAHAHGVHLPPAPPWNSNLLSTAVGVLPEEFERHTAMGDVLWVRAQYDAVMGGAK